MAAAIGLRGRSGAGRREKNRPWRGAPGRRRRASDPPPRLADGASSRTFSDKNIPQGSQDTIPARARGPCAMPQTRLSAEGTAPPFGPSRSRRGPYRTFDRENMAQRSQADAQRVRPSPWCSNRKASLRSLHWLYDAAFSTGRSGKCSSQSQAVIRGFTT